MFRKKALDKLQSPDDLNQLLTVINIQTWLFVVIIGGVCAGTLIWSVLARLPINVNGFGVLVNPGNVRPVQTIAGGPVMEVFARPGAHVDKGQVLGIVSQPLLNQELDSLREKQRKAISLNEFIREADADQARLETESIEKQLVFLREEVESEKSQHTRVNTMNAAYLQRQEEVLNQSRKLTLDLQQLLAKRSQSVDSLRKEGLTADDLLISSRSSMMDNELSLSNLDARLQELGLKKADLSQAEIQQQSRIFDLQLKQLQLEIQKNDIEYRLIRSEKERQSQLDDLQASIDQIQLRLRKEGEIVSAFSGMLLELHLLPGQIVQPGIRVGVVEVDNPGAKLTNLAYFRVRDGKLIRPGDRIYITPTTVRREQYGSIIGRVTRVSGFPVTQETVIANIGSAEIAAGLVQSGGAIEVEADMQTDPESYSGYSWTSRGPDLKFSAGTITSVRVTVEERAPITYVMPIFRTWLFGEQDDQESQL
jgi:HlyD family secretion protein